MEASALELTIHRRDPSVDSSFALSRERRVLRARRPEPPPAGPVAAKRARSRPELRPALSQVNADGLGVCEALYPLAHGRGLPVHRSRRWLTPGRTLARLAPAPLRHL